MGRRFFKRFEERIECLICKHMRLVDYVHLCVQFKRHERSLVHQHAHVVNAGVGCGVHFDNVEGGAFAHRAGSTLAAGAAIDGGKTVYGAREYFGRARFTRSASSAE